MISFMMGRFIFGLFSYWIGISVRNPKPYKTIDLGFFKIMWQENK